MLWAYVGTPIYLTLSILLLAFVTRYSVYGVRTLSAGIMQIDKSLEEAAMISGATSFRTFLAINMPLLRPVLASIWLLVFMIVMRELSASIILYGPGSVTLPILTWGYLNDGFYGIASALAILQVVFVAAVVVVFRWLFGVEIKTGSRAGS
jgi:iron(III) transport system permease protein